jgi:hypothetical protein
MPIRWTYSDEGDFTAIAAPGDSLIHDNPGKSLEDPVSGH